MDERRGFEGWGFEEEMKWAEVREGCLLTLREGRD